MKTTVGKCTMDIATGWAASLGLSIPTWKKGDELLVEVLDDGTFRSITEPAGIILEPHLLDLDL